MNTEDSKKKRFLRDLRAGRRKTISRTVVNKYKWTMDELKILEPYISEDNPSLITNTQTSDCLFTKKDAFDLIDKYVENETTKKNYKSRVNALSKLMNVQNQQFSDIFKDNVLLSKRIIDTYKDPTSYFAFILYIFGKSQKLSACAPKNTFDIMKKHFDDFKTKTTVDSLKARREDIQYEKVYKTVFETEKHLSDTQYGSMKHLIAVMYSHALYGNNNVIHINPRNYFLKVVLVSDDSQMDDTQNFYNITSGRLLLNDYKTSKIYEPYDVYMSDYTRKVIAESLKQRPRTYLIEKSDGGVYANNTLSNTIKTIFKGLTINTIRKGIESYEVNVQYTDRVHLAKVSRHTVLTQEVSYLAQ